MIKTLQWCTRVAGTIALIIGILIGRGSASLVRPHLFLGYVVVAVLVLIAIMGFAKRLSPALPLVGLVWAAVTVYIGYAQFGLMTGDTHWVIQVLHALLGVGAMGLAEALGARVKRAG